MHVSMRDDQEPTEIVLLCHNKTIQEVKKKGGLKKRGSAVTQDSKKEISLYSWKETRYPDRHPPTCNLCQDRAELESGSLRTWHGVIPLENASPQEVRGAPRPQSDRVSRKGRQQRNLK